jgi:hypothetical protein
MHFIPETTSIVVKEAYFKACDVMIHGRKDGEMFSMAIAEASIHNIPVMTTLIPGTPLQPVVLQNKAFLYSNRESLLKQFKHFITQGVPKDRNFNAYEEYSPKNVMERFSRIFIEGPLHHKTYLDPKKLECYDYFEDDIQAINAVIQNKTELSKFATSTSSILKVKFVGIEVNEPIPQKQQQHQHESNNDGVKERKFHDLGQVEDGFIDDYKKPPILIHSVHRTISRDGYNYTVAVTGKTRVTSKGKMTIDKSYEVGLDSGADVDQAKERGEDVVLPIVGDEKSIERHVIKQQPKPKPPPTPNIDSIQQGYFTKQRLDRPSKKIKFSSPNKSSKRIENH